MQKRACTECDKCKQAITNNNFRKHYINCIGEVNYWSKVHKGEFVVDHTVDCKFCSKILKNSNSRRNHERLCSLNPDRQYTPFQTDQQSVQKIRHASGGCNQYTKAKRLGLPKPEISPETRQKYRDSRKQTSNQYWSDPANRKLKSEKMSLVVSRKMTEGTWHTRGHAKKIAYKDIVFDSSWEVKYAQWLDANNTPWERCRENFEYIFEGSLKRYTPDFYLPSTDEYIEIKGFSTDKDIAKWTQFPSDRKLVILLGDDLKDLGIL
jgi:hypothetical protein